MLMRQNLLHHRNRLSITQWLERSVLSFSFCPVSVSQTAPYSSRRRSRLKDPKSPNVFERSEILGNHLLLGGEIDENRVVSPLSFQVVLSLLAAGFRGSTRRQLLTFFRTDSVDRLNSFASQISDGILAGGDPGVDPCIRCSNGLWIDESLTLKPSFKQIIDSDYRAALNPVDLKTKGPHVRQQINSWVENETSGLVKDHIHEEHLNKSVKLVFTNALYFKGAWDGESCPPEWDGLSGPTFVSKEDQENENLVMAPLMTVKRKEYFRWYDGCGILNQPFKKPMDDKRSVNMLFYYPGADTEHGLRTHVTETFVDVCGRMTPKFNISSEVEASDVLRQLGVTLPFSGAKLTEMLSPFDGPKLYVFNIFHKAIIDINEQGTEAAAATTAILMSGRRRSDLPDVPKIEYEYRSRFLLFGGIDEVDSIHMAKTKLVVTQVVNPLPRGRKWRRRTREGGH